MAHKISSFLNEKSVTNRINNNQKQTSLDADNVHI